MDVHAGAEAGMHEATHTLAPLGLTATLAGTTLEPNIANVVTTPVLATICRILWFT